MVLAQASVDACNDPLDHLQGPGTLITCVVHLVQIHDYAQLSITVGLAE